MSIAEQCNLCKNKLANFTNNDSKVRLTCASCGAECDYFFLENEKNDPPDLKNEKNDPPDLVANKDTIPPDKTYMTPVEEELNICNKSSNVSSSDGENNTADHTDHNENNENNYHNYNNEEIRENKTDSLKNIKTTNINIDKQVISQNNGYHVYKNNPIFAKGLAKLDEFAEILNLEYSIIEKSKDNLSLVYSLKKFQGRSLVALVVSVIFATCKQYNYPKTFKEIEKLLKLNKEVRCETMRSISSLRDIVVNSTTISSNVMGLVRKYCENMKLNQGFTNACVEIAEKICDKGFIDGKLPSTVASACIFYVDCYLKLKIDEVFLNNLCEASSLNKNTITNAYNSLRDSFKQLIVKCSMGNSNASNAIKTA